MIQKVLLMVLIILQTMLTVPQGSIAQETADAVESKEGDKQTEEKKEIASVEIKVKPIQIYKSVEGRFESTATSEIKTDFEKWSDLEISSISDEGIAVTSGQTLLSFDTESIDEAIANAEFSLRSAEFGLDDAKLEMEELNSTFDMDVELAERAWKNAQQDFEYYRNIEVPDREKELDYDEKTAGYSLEYSKDELDQLEQMYTEDDLTEESEEIVLKRARRSVESSKRYMDRTMRRLVRQREIDNPRTDLRMDDELKRSEIEFKKKSVSLPIKKRRAEVALAKAEFELANKQKALEELRRDRNKMDLKSDSNGVLYYGRCQRGKWMGASGSPVRRMEPGKKLPAKKVVLTVVDPNQMIIRVDMDEKLLSSISVNMQGKAKVAAAGDLVVPVVVSKVNRIPMENNKFDCEIKPQNLEKDRVMPGMTCKMSFLVYENEQAVVAPKKSVFSDDDGFSHYVYVVNGEETTRREVKVGKTSGDDVEIMEGLTTADKIAKEKP